MIATLGLHPSQLFHIGIVAADFDATLAEFSRAFGLRWRGGKPTVMDAWIDGKRRSIEMRIAHSVEGPPHHEVIAAVPDTPWDPTKSGVHHVCYWSDVAASICATLEATPGYRRVLGEVGSDSGYFLSPNPANDIAYLTYNLSANADLTISVKNELGQVILSKILRGVQSGTLEITTLEWANGIYAVDIEKGKSRIVKKLVVHH